MVTWCALLFVDLYVFQVCSTIPYKCLDLEREKSLKKLTLEHDELAPWCFDVSQLTGAN